MKKCKICKTKFEPLRPLQMVCSPKCGFEYSKQQRDKQWKERKKVIKESLTTRADHMKIAQASFNAYIRQRDKDKPCISCGTYNGKMNAGHYMSVGSTPELRFNEDNVHKQCERCNTHLSGNLVNYRISLIERIGVLRVHELERKDHPPLKLTIEEIQGIAKKYRKKLKKNQ
jgi:ribosomal protein L37E